MLSDMRFLLLDASPSGDEAVNEAELDRVEDALGRSLPKTLRGVMLDFPQQLIDAATMTDPDGNDFVDCMMFTPFADYIIAGIRHCRQLEGWPADYLVVGDNGCGEEFSVDISTEKCSVFISGPHNDAGAHGPTDKGYFEQVSPDVRQWVDALADRAI